LCHNKQVCKIFDGVDHSQLVNIVIFSSQDTNGINKNHSLGDLKSKSKITYLKLILNQIKRLPNRFKITILNQMLLNHCRQWSRYTNHSTMQFVQEHYHNYEEKIKKIDIVDRKKT